ncbi:MAG TPA: tail fiber protein [Candidatus Bathyarchaeia archaeon]|nr:tail fiber protein [Candidatus Bathyarchaeia archaeon]
MRTRDETKRVHSVAARYVSRARLRGFLAVLVVLACSTQVCVEAQPIQRPPDFVSYQGTLLLASDGVTPVTGASDIEFRLYANETDDVASAVWGEIHEDVPIFNGVFNVFLGGGDPIDGVPKEALADVFKNSPRWLGIKVGLDAEMTSRQKISSVPYALTATHVSTAIHGAPVGTIMMFAGPSPPPGWIFCTGQQLNATTNPEYAALYDVIGTAWGGTGATSFYLPNFRGRTPIGSGTGIDANTDTGFGKKAGLTARAVNTAVGNDTATVNIEQMPEHMHEYWDRYIDFPGANLVQWGLVKHAAHPTDLPQDTTGNTGLGQPHNNVQPSTYINFMIKL